MKVRLHRTATLKWVSPDYGTLGQPRMEPINPERFWRGLNRRAGSMVAAGGWVVPLEKIYQCFAFWSHRGACPSGLDSGEARKKPIWPGPGPLPGAQGLPVLGGARARGAVSLPGPRLPHWPTH